MSGLGGFLKNHRMTLIVPPVLAAEFYIWWRIQQMECYVPAEDKKEIFIKSFEYARTLYGPSTTDGHDTGEKSV